MTTIELQPLSDAELVASVLAGDAGRFEQLYRRHAPMVRRVIAASVRDSSSADDGVQEVFIRVLDRLGSLRDPDRLPQWLRSIARNVATDLVRTRSNLDLDDAPAAAMADRALGADELTELRELAHLVTGAMTELPARDLRVISMAAFLDASPTEIAEALDISPGAARVVLHRARKRLYGALKFVVLLRRRAAACSTFTALADDDVLAAGRHLSACTVCLHAGSAEIKLYGDGPSRLARGEQAEVLVYFADGNVKQLGLRQRLVVGRECLGVPADQRLLIEDTIVSRQHLELRENESGQVFAVDTSSNGSLLNGVPMERAAIVALGSGDRLRVGPIDLELRFVAGSTTSPGSSTARVVAEGTMALVAGDLTGARGRVERDELLDELLPLLRLYGGTVANFSGNGFVAVWQVDEFADGFERALDFTLLARATVARRAAKVEPADAPLVVGWGATIGDTSMSVLGGAVTTVVGDTAQVAVALASLAARDDTTVAFVSAPLELGFDQFEFGTAHAVTIGGISEPVAVRAFLSRRHGARQSSS